MKSKLIEVLKNIKKSKLFWIPVAVILALIIFRFKGILVAATVNGEPISRISLVQQLEKQGGKTVLDNLVTNALILQEAKKQKVTVTPQEITDQIAKISDNLKKQGQDLDQALAAQGMTKSDLNDQVKLQILVQKLAGQGIEVTDKEAQDYFNQNKGTYPKNTKLETVKDQIISDLKSQKLNDKITKWLSELKTNAKISYFVNY
ncbi:MAG TPA: SurA N-terminal domain-containing protein [Candidatus Saccharimonadales bacterium]|nr:SurA N-terminal domain-containing protein [Candidatus Saccharimonadales bacterium]